jgi:hypothetical protein
LEVAIKWHLSTRDCADNEIERLSIVLSPIGVFVGRDILVSPELEHVVALLGFPADSDDLVGT